MDKKSRSEETIQYQMRRVKESSKLKKKKKRKGLLKGENVNTEIKQGPVSHQDLLMFYKRTSRNIV